MASSSTPPPDIIPRASEDLLLVGGHTASSLVSHLIGPVLLMPLLEPLGHGGVMATVFIGGLVAQPPLRAFRLRTRLGLPRTLTNIFVTGITKETPSECLLTPHTGLLESAVVEVYSAVAWVLLSEAIGGLAPLSLASRLMLNLSRDPMVWIVRAKFPSYPSWL
jgi:hypothetical protein